MTQPYFEDGDIRLYNADCMDVLPTLADESVDIVVTSPPYNMGLVPGGNGRGTYLHSSTAENRKGARFGEGYDGDGDDAMPQDEYETWQRSVLAECWRVARLAVFYNHRPRVEHGRLRVPLGFDYGAAVLRQIIVIDRGTGIDVNLRHFCTRGEWLLFFAKPALELVSHAASGMGDVWRLGPETNVREHPAPFPVGLPARCIDATGARSVLDPFVGSGSTLRAAKNAGIAGDGIEKHLPYCELAVRRLSQGSLFGASA